MRPEGRQKKMGRSRSQGVCIHGKWWRRGKDGKLYPTIWPCVAQKGDPYYHDKKIATKTKPVKKKRIT